MHYIMHFIWSVLLSSVMTHNELEYTACVTGYKEEHLMSCYTHSNISGLIPSNHCFIAHEACEMSVHEIVHVQTDFCNATKWKWACTPIITIPPTTTAIPTTIADILVQMVLNPTTTRTTVTNNTYEECTCTDWQNTTYILLGLVIVLGTTASYFGVKLNRRHRIYPTSTF